MNRANTVKRVGQLLISGSRKPTRKRPGETSPDTNPDPGFDYRRSGKQPLHSAPGPTERARQGPPDALVPRLVAGGFVAADDEVGEAEPGAFGALRFVGAATSQI